MAIGPVRRFPARRRDMKAIIQRHPAASYFLLAIALSWAGIVAVVWPGPIPASVSEAERLFVPVYLAMLVGPSVGGLTIAALAGGRAGLRAYRERLLAWRVEAGWYAVALLTAPMAIALALLTLSIVSPAFVPAILSGHGHQEAAGPIHAASTLAFVVTGLAVGIGAGLFEELGWTGVAVPKMLPRHGLFVTGVGVGLVWGAWHFLAIYWGSGDAMGSVPAPVYLLIALFSFLPPYRILMVWVYQHTRSLLIGILMHASLTSSMLILGPAVAGRELLTYDLTLAAVFWIAAGVVLALEGRRTRTDGIRHGADLELAG
jgi:membrane protease YdiL (CAAX protease family)